MKKILLFILFLCIICVNTVTLIPSVKSKCNITFGQIECLADNEGSGSGSKPYLSCSTGTLNVGIHGIYTIRWCGDCLFHRVLITGSGDCRLN